MKYQKQIFTWVAIFVVLIIAYLVVVVMFISPAEQNANTLAIGQRSIVESLSVPITAGTDLNNLSRTEIFDLRRQAVMEYPWLIYTKYDPSGPVFSKVKDGLAWWGNAGWYYYGSGDNSSSGLSKDAVQILNPYLLVSVDFSGLSIHAKEGGENFWIPNISAAALAKDTFPYYPLPENLRWWPERGRIEVTYDLSDYLAVLKHWTAQSPSLAKADFDLIAMNAHDLNMNYIWVDYSQALNIIKDNAPADAAAISHRLVSSNDCGLPGGCNSLDASMPEIQGLQLKGLPAKLIVYLWNERPASTSETPDITYVINIK